MNKFKSILINLENQMKWKHVRKCWQNNESRRKTAKNLQKLKKPTNVFTNLLKIFTLKRVIKQFLKRKMVN